MRNKFDVLNSIVDNNNDNLNYKADNFINNILETLDEMAPVSEIVVKNKEKKWFTQELKKPNQIISNF